MAMKRRYQRDEGQYVDRNGERLSIDRCVFDAASGFLLDDDGEPLAKVVGLTVELGRGVGGVGVVSGNSSVLEGQTSSGGRGVGEPSALRRELDAMQRCWDYWTEISGKRQKLDDTRKGILRNALATLKESTGSLEEAERLVKRALLGLTRSPHHQGQNPERREWMEIKYALKGNRRDSESDDTRIEKAITWGAQYAPEAQMDPAKVARLLDYMRYTKSLPHHPERERAMDAYKQLKTAGFEVESLDGPPWIRINRG